MEGTGVSRREPPKVVIEYVLVDGPEGEQPAIRQGAAIREVLERLHTHHGSVECNEEADGNTESRPRPSRPSV